MVRRSHSGSKSHSASVTKSSSEAARQVTIRMVRRAQATAAMEPREAMERLEVHASLALADTTKDMEWAILRKITATAALTLVASGMRVCPMVAQLTGSHMHQAWL